MSYDAAVDGVPIKDGLYGTVSDVTYHADRGSLSFSGAKRLLPPSCPAKFREYRDNPPKPKKEYDFGHLVHRLRLGKGADLVEIDAPDYKKKVAQDARDKAYADGKTPVLPHQMLAAERMVKVCDAHTYAGPLFHRGYAEVSLYHNDPAGVRLRGRPDWLTLVDERLWCVDFKTSTTANPSELVRKFWQFGYYMQAAWYLDLLIALEISDQPAFIFIVQEKEPPYLVTPVEYDAEAIAEGRRQNRLAINLYNHCRLVDEWPGYTEGIVPLRLPPWAFHQPTINDLIEENA